MDSVHLSTLSSQQALAQLPGGEPPAVWRATASGSSGAHFRLEPGLALLANKSGGLLLSLYPLCVIRLDPKGFALLSHLDIDRTVDELAAREPAIAAADVAAFIDSLARRRFLSKKPPVLTMWPMVSVIVPAHGRPAATRACLESLLLLDYPAERLEIIVIDDASDPPLAESLAGLPVRLMRQERNVGQSAARNLAALEARGELLAFIDNDCVGDPHWLRMLIPYLSDPAIGIVGGRVLAPLPSGRIAAFEAVRSPLDMGPNGGEVGPNEAVAYLPTCNLVVRRELLLATGGFDTEMCLGEDVDFIWRALRSGARACYVPAGKIVHFHRVRLEALLRRRADYGSSEADLQLRHPQARRVMPLPVVCTLLLTAMVAGLAHSWLAGTVLAVLALLGVAFELVEKHWRLWRMGVDVPPQRVNGAVWREHMASLHHLSANVTRYYSLPLLAASVLWPSLLPATATLLLVSPTSDYRRLRPCLSMTVFIGLYWLEMAAYQVGVWRGCLKQRTLGPLIPMVCVRR